MYIIIKISFQYPVDNFPHATYPSGKMCICIYIISIPFFAATSQLLQDT